jgi:hypothetical protein
MLQTVPERVYPVGQEYEVVGVTVLAEVVTLQVVPDCVYPDGQEYEAVPATVLEGVITVEAGMLHTVPLSVPPEGQLYIRAAVAGKAL